MNFGFQEALTKGVPGRTGGAWRAFTLTEVLVVTAIASILAVLLLPAWNSARRAADRTEAISGLQQIGRAIHGYAADNQGSLPGPLWSGQDPRYTKWQPLSLGHHLWSYLGSADPEIDPSVPKVAKALSPKAYEKFAPNRDVPSVFLNINVTIDGETINPWGWRPTEANPDPSPPERVVRLAAAGLSKTWAMHDVDKTAVPPNVGSWHSKLPPKPLYEPVRLKLYFDGHVASESLGD